MGKTDKIIEVTTELITVLSSAGSSLALGVATTPAPFIPALLGVAGMGVFLQGKQSLEFRKICELTESLKSKLDQIGERTLWREDYAAFARNVADVYLKEVSDKKREMIRAYLVNASINFEDFSIQHAAILNALQNITPNNFLALLDISKAVSKAMDWDLNHNKKKLTFEYGIMVIQANLQEFDLRAPALLRLPTLDSVLRTLSSLDLVHVRDYSGSGLGGGGKHLEVINITPLGHQLIHYVYPEEYSNVFFREEFTQDTE